TVYETGNNRWRNFNQWPPAESKQVNYYLQDAGKLSTNKPTGSNKSTSYVSDPAKPVPYTNGVFRGRNNEYMVEDQRFAANRPDVLVFESDSLTEDLTLAGPIIADLFVSTTGTDADFIVKVIDVFPATEPNKPNMARGTAMGGTQRMVRAEVFRGKFRNSFSKPVPFIPGKVSEVKYTLNDILHTFKKGHRIMIQVQSSWFPLVDRNPQKFMRIPDANESDFQKATIKIHHDNANPSSISLPVLR
ncbi:MAG TPA: CocE/NonD family hydrolase, partial [Chitinophagaceae bacterium]|nr:CocE/NonD family hydrolase [Chitinophagaceae bacterium]